jgi:hypothetical protein
MAAKSTNSLKPDAFIPLLDALAVYLQLRKDLNNLQEEGQVKELS